MADLAGLPQLTAPELDELRTAVIDRIWLLTTLQSVTPDTSTMRPGVDESLAIVRSLDTAVAEARLSIREPE